MPIYDYECKKCGKVFEFIKSMREDPKVWCICGGEAVQLISCFQTPKDKLFDFVDVHTTGKPIHFTSQRQWESHLKRLGKYQLNKADIKKLQIPIDRTPKSNYRDVAEKAWKERGKFVMDVKYGRRKLSYA